MNVQRLERKRGVFLSFQRSIFFFLETPKHFGFDARTRRASSVPSLLYHYNNSLSIIIKKKSFRTCRRELATLAHTHTHTNTAEHRRAEQFTLHCVFIFPRFVFSLQSDRKTKMRIMTIIVVEKKKKTKKKRYNFEIDEETCIHTKKKTTTTKKEQ